MNEAMTPEILPLEVKNEQKKEQNLPQKVEPPRPPQLATKDEGLLALATIQEQMNFAQKLIDTKMISDTFKTPQQVLIGIQYAKELGLPVVAALKMMYVLKGKPNLYGDGPLGLCQSKGLVEGLVEFFINEKGEKICFENKNLKDQVWGSVTRIKRKGDSEWQEDYFTKQDLEKAKMDIGSNGKKEVWDKYERNMYRYKSRAMSIKSKFADVVGGVPIAEYDNHFSPETPEIQFNQTNEAADDINQTYGNEEKPAS